MNDFWKNHRLYTAPVADIELPGELGGLYELAYNLWWSWNPAATDLFHRIDGPAWELYRNPVQLLINVEPTHWQPLLESEPFRSAYENVLSELRTYLATTRQAWYGSRFGSAVDRPIAYFSMEYGLHVSLAIYSGGLGILSGDHLKTASDLGLPLVGVGLLYRCGYFRQTVDPEGLQQHFYPRYDFSRLGLRPVAGPTGRPLRVTVPILDREVQAMVWLAQVGRVPLLLLDTDVPENRPGDRAITNILYVRGREMRLLQELVLGIGGVRALEALGIEPEVWHINEGHCATLQLERLRRILGSGRRNQEALDDLRERVLFTTHTPVPAGNETFDRSLAASYVEPLARGMGVDSAEIFALADAGRDEGNFNLTALGLKTAQRANAVSKLNAEVTSDMWRHLDLPRQEGGDPITPITNGVHVPTWIGNDIRQLFERHLGSDWVDRLLDQDAWAAIESLDDDEVWAARKRQRARLRRFAHGRWRRQFARHGRAPQELEAVDGLLKPDSLLIGFARRFATYKRARLIFQDLERLRGMLDDPDRPVQILFAGKAHPADRPGQDLIRQIFELSQSEELRGHVFFLEDYDMRVGRQLVQGVDVWLNTPLRPLEASGTSGQKAAMNGALNVSILDGWWPEGFDGDNGWAIEVEGEQATGEEQDRRDADALYTTLEDKVIPIFFDRDEAGLPHEWVRRVKHAIATITPEFSSHRMIRDYSEQHYAPLLGIEADE